MSEAAAPPSEKRCVFAGCGLSFPAGGKAAVARALAFRSHVASCATKSQKDRERHVRRLMTARLLAERRGIAWRSTRHAREPLDEGGAPA